MRKRNSPLKVLVDKTKGIVSKSQPKLTKNVQLIPNYKPNQTNLRSVTKSKLKMSPTPSTSTTVSGAPKVTDSKGDTGTKYKDVITWMRPFDGSKEQYMQFSNDCDRCFKAVENWKIPDLINYVLSKLNSENFAFTLGTDFKTWSELKKALDEHFRIRLNEKFLFRELTDMTKGSDDLFKFYNRLIAKCYEYKTFLKSTFEDKGTEFIEFRVAQAEEYALDSFIMAVGANFRPLIRDKKPKNIQEAYNMLRDLEIGTGMDSSDGVDAKMSEMLHLLKMGNNNSSFTKPQINRVEEVQKSNFETRICQLCEREGHTAKFCWISQNTNSGFDRYNPGSNNNNGNNYFRGNNNFKNNFPKNNPRFNNNKGYNNNNNRNFNGHQQNRNNNNFRQNPPNNHYRGNNYRNWQGGEVHRGQYNFYQGQPQVRSYGYCDPHSYDYSYHTGGRTGQVEFSTQQVQPHVAAIDQGAAGGSGIIDNNVVQQ